MIRSASEREEAAFLSCFLGSLFHSNDFKWNAFIVDLITGLICDTSKKKKIIMVAKSICRLSPPYDCRLTNFGTAKDLAIVGWNLQLQCYMHKLI